MSPEYPEYMGSTFLYFALYVKGNMVANLNYKNEVSDTNHAHFFFLEAVFFLLTSD